MDIGMWIRDKREWFRISTPKDRKKNEIERIPGQKKQSGRERSYHATRCTTLKRTFKKGKEGSTQGEEGRREKTKG